MCIGTCFSSTGLSSKRPSHKEQGKRTYHAFPNLASNCNIVAHVRKKWSVLMYPWLHLGPAVISTYSLMFLCAYIAGVIVTYYEAKRQHRANEAILRVALGALGGGLIGAKLSMLIFLGPATFIKDLPYLWYSGQAWTGAFFGGYAGVLLIKRLN